MINNNITFRKLIISLWCNLPQANGWLRKHTQPKQFWSGAQPGQILTIPRRTTANACLMLEDFETFSSTTSISTTFFLKILLPIKSKKKFRKSLLTCQSRQNSNVVLIKTQDWLSISLAMLHLTSLRKKIRRWMPWKYSSLRMSRLIFERCSAR